MHAQQFVHLIKIYQLCASYARCIHTHSIKVFETFRKTCTDERVKIIFLLIHFFPSAASKNFSSLNWSRKISLLFRVHEV